MINNGMFTSTTFEWSTPQDLFDTLNAEFHFTLDVCATKENAKCEKYFSLDDDGLSQEWTGTCWMNPPYGKDIKRWIKKAYESKTTVVCLIPSRTDTGWWHDYVMEGEVRFIRGRLKFSGTKRNAPFPSALVIFRGDSL
jgi:phage N-6-adenine-methyltransferase